MRRTLLALLLLVVAPLVAQSVDSMSFDPSVIRVNRTTPATMQVQTSGVIPSMRLDLAAGGSIIPTAQGGGRYSVSVPANALLFNYNASNINHNLVGFLRLLDGTSTVLVSYNIFIGVLDDLIPPVTIKALANNARRTDRILNIFRPSIGILNVDQAAIEFYRYFPDSFDFLVIAYSAPSYFQNRYHFAVKNEITGIGQQIFHKGAAYGSAGKLLGVTVYPSDAFFDFGETGFCHETGHQWILYSTNSLLQPGPHWPMSTMARNIMGFNIPGSNVGGDFPWLIQQQSGGTYRFVSDQTTREFSDFDLYLMGLMDPSEVQQGLVLINQSQTPCNGCTIQGAVFTFRVQDLIGADGPRAPTAANAQKSFRTGTVVVTHDRLMTDDEITWFEYFAARGEALTTLSFASGLAKGISKPWYVATRGRSTMNLSLDPTPPKRRAVKR